MILTPQEIKQQTRALWKECFHDSEEFMDIYFEEKYTDQQNITVREDGKVIGAMQVIPYPMTFHRLMIFTGYVSGLCVSPEHRKRGVASQLLRQAHRELYRQGAALSFVIPADEGLRHFYEKPEHGAYWTATYRKEVEMEDKGEDDPHVEIQQPDEWPMELYVFFRRYSGFDFMLHHSENDFFAALDDCDNDNGYVLVARRKRRIVGLCLAVPEADGRVFMRSLLVTHQEVKDLFVRQLKQLAGVDHIYARVPSPGAVNGATPFAMARVINVKHFLSAVVKAYPDFEIHIGVDGDLDVPENNGFYLVGKGKVQLTDQRPDSIVTPGGLAAMFLGAHPTLIEMMLNE